MVRDRGDPSALRWLIGTELVNARKRAKVSQKQAASVLGCSHVTISYMEAGTTVQEPARITQLLKCYGCDQAHKSTGWRGWPEGTPTRAVGGRISPTSYSMAGHVRRT